MKKNIKILFCVLVFLILGICFYLFIYQNNQQKNIRVRDLAYVGDDEIVKILKTNKDIAEYTQKYPDFKIESKEILTTEKIAEGQKDQNFAVVYYGLESQDGRYMKVQLMDQVGSHGFIGVIDFNDNKVLKAFGILLFQATANQS